MSSGSSQQRHQHGVKKNLVEGIGGVLIGASLVLFVRGLVKRRAAERAAPVSSEASTTAATLGD